MVVALADLAEEIAPEELAEMGSLNHGYLQLKIGAYFLTIPDLTPTSEFALDTSALLTLPDIELVGNATALEPDIAVFRELSIDFQNDLLKSKDTPVLVVEILSPRQGVQTLVDKFKLYFALGIQSCWLVYPHAKAIAVYHSPSAFEMFVNGDLVDGVVNIRLSLREVFSS